jgi:hypothetical protein
MLKISVDLISLAGSREPRLFFVQKAPEFAAFKQYIRSEPELRLELRTVGFKDITLAGIVELYGKHNKVLADSYIPWLPVSELYEIREYDRDKFEGNWNGRKTKKEYEAQEKYIAQNGFSVDDYGIVHIYRKDENTVAATLGEGNHRVEIATKKGAPLRMPVLILYNRG